MAEEAAQKNEEDAFPLQDVKSQDADTILDRHMTVDLDPRPLDERDPLNWPQWKKITNLLLVSLLGMTSGANATSLVPAFDILADYFDTSSQRISYLLAMQIALFGFAPLFWKPVSKRIGRRQVWLISTAVAAIANVGCACSNSYPALAVCRCIFAFFISPGTALGPAVVVETFRKESRGLATGVWNLFVNLGPPSGAFLTGFIVQRVSWRWIFWVSALFNGAQFILFIFFGPETRYLVTKRTQHMSQSKREYLTFGRIDPTPFKLQEFLLPFSFLRHFTALGPALMYALSFTIGSVFLTTIIPQLYVDDFDFDPQDLGVSMISLVIGTLLGELAVGPISDLWMQRRQSKLGGAKPQPQYRLWLAYLPIITLIIGTVVFCVQTENLADAGIFDISPLIGAAIAAFGNQMLSSVSVTFAVDCFPLQSAELGTFMNMMKMTIGFEGPFWFPDTVDSLGLKSTAGLLSGLIAVFCLGPVILLQFKGAKRRDEGIEEERTNDAYENLRKV